MQIHFVLLILAVVGPGYPRRGRQIQGWGANLLFGQFFSQKVHENERNWTKPRGGTHRWYQCPRGIRQLLVM